MDNREFVRRAFELDAGRRRGSATPPPPAKGANMPIFKPVPPLACCDACGWPLPLDPNTRICAECAASAAPFSKVKS